MLHKNQLKSQSRSSTTLTPQNPSILIPKTKQLSKSYVSSKDLTNQQLLNNQIVYFKQKAHQSFMQVIQMQQLHQQELQELRQEMKQKQKDHQKTIQNFTIKAKRIQQLQHRIQQLQSRNVLLQKNYKHHACNFEQDDLSIDSIQSINCKEDSKLDDSAIINFTQIIGFNKHQEQLKSIQHQIIKEVYQITHHVYKNYQECNLYQMIQKLFQYITFLKQEFIKFKLNILKETGNKKQYQSLQQETKFMTEHIKRLSTQKMKVQKKLLQTERQLKKSQQKVKKMQSSLSVQGTTLDQTNLKQTLSIRVSGQQNTIQSNQATSTIQNKPINTFPRKIKN